MLYSSEIFVAQRGYKRAGFIYTFIGFASCGIKIFFQVPPLFRNAYFQKPSKKSNTFWITPIIQYSFDVHEPERFFKSQRRIDFVAN